MTEIWQKFDLFIFIFSLCEMAKFFYIIFFIWTTDFLSLHRDDDGEEIINTNILLRGDIERECERTRITSSSLSPVRSSDESDILEKESKLPLRSAEPRPRFDACNSVGDALRLAPVGTLALPETSNNNDPNLLEFLYSRAFNYSPNFFCAITTTAMHTYFLQSIHWFPLY